MADEQIVGAESAPEPTDIRSIISNRLAEQRGASAAPPAEVGTGVSPGIETPASDAGSPVEGTTQEKAAAAPRERGPDGKFAKAAEAQAESVDPAAALEKPEGEPSKSMLRPPPGWSPTAKAQFDALPDSIKQAVAKREEEINKGFEKYSGLDQYVKMATEGGTSLPKALEQYVGIENVLRRDIFSGVEQILKNCGTNTRDFLQQYLARFGGAAPQQAAPSAQSNPQMFDPEKIRREAADAALSAIQEREATSAVTAFSADPTNRYFENVKPMMAELLAAGRAADLKDAYDKACWADPEIRELLINERAKPVPQPTQKAPAATQARQAARATVGAPTPGFVPKPDTAPAQDLRQTIQWAMDRQRGQA